MSEQWHFHCPHCGARAVGRTTEDRRQAYEDQHAEWCGKQAMAVVKSTAGEVRITYSPVSSNNATWSGSPAGPPVEFIQTTDAPDSDI